MTKKRILIFLGLFCIILIANMNKAHAFTEPEFKNMIQGLYDKAVTENNTLIKTITGVIIEHELEDEIYNYTGNSNGGFGAFDSIYIFFANNSATDYYLFNCYLFNTNENSKGYIGLLSPTGRALMVTNLPTFRSSYHLLNLSFRINKRNYTILRNQDREYSLSQYNNFYIFNNGNNGTNYNMSARVAAMITKQFKIYTNDNMNILSTEDYFLKGFYPEEPPPFVFNQNTQPYIVYDHQYKYLGNLIGDFDKSKIWFRLVNTSTGGSIATTFDNNIIINSDNEVYVKSRLLYPGNYDLYLGYNDGNFETELYYYTFSLDSGDTGYNDQNLANDLPGIIQDTNNDFWRW